MEQTSLDIFIGTLTRLDYLDYNQDWTGAVIGAIISSDWTGTPNSPKELPPAHSFFRVPVITGASTEPVRPRWFA